MNAAVPAYNLLECDKSVLDLGPSSVNPSFHQRGQSRREGVGAALPSAPLRRNGVGWGKGFWLRLVGSCEGVMPRPRQPLLSEGHVQCPRGQCWPGCCPRTPTCSCLSFQMDQQRPGQCHSRAAWPGPRERGSAGTQPGPSRARSRATLAILPPHPPSPGARATSSLCTASDPTQPQTWPWGRHAFSW